MIRIALVAEGVTDFEILHAVIEVLLNGASFDLKLLQPEESVAFTDQGNAGPFGGGWKGVYKWCLQAVQRGGGRLSDDPLFFGYDLLLIHLDADVAHEDPANSKISPIPELAGVLPCAKPCSTPRDTADALRLVMLSWVGEDATPPATVLCTPSKSTDAWVMASLFPNDREMNKVGWECYLKPERRLSQQPVRTRIKKSQEDYSNCRAEIQSNWERVYKTLFEAKRFQDEFLAAANELVSN